PSNAATRTSLAVRYDLGSRAGASDVVQKVYRSPTSPSSTSRRLKPAQEITPPAAVRSTGGSVGTGPWLGSSGPTDHPTPGTPARSNGEGLKDTHPFLDMRAASAASASSRISSAIRSASSYRA